MATNKRSRPRRTPPAKNGPAVPETHPVAPPSSPLENRSLAETGTAPTLSAGSAARDAQSLPQIAGLVRRLRELPAVRPEKILAARQAIQTGTFDDEARLDGCLNRLHEDIGILCRRQTGEAASDEKRPPKPTAATPVP